MRDALPPIRNRLLRSIPRAQLAPFEAALRPEPLLKGQVVYDGCSAVDEVYFVETGIVSLTTNVGDRVWVEVGMAGREGMVGWSALLNSRPDSDAPGCRAAAGRSPRRPDARFSCHDRADSRVAERLLAIRQCPDDPDFSDGGMQWTSSVA